MAGGKRRERRGMKNLRCIRCILRLPMRNTVIMYCTHELIKIEKRIELRHLGKCMCLETIMLSEINQIHKLKYHLVSLI